MNSSHRLVKNTLSQIVAHVAANVVFFGFYVLFSRQFGREGIGIYAFSLALTTILFIGADYGLTTYLVPEVSRKRERLPRYLGNAVLVKVGLSVLGTGLMIALAPLFHLSAQGYQALWLIGASQVLYRLGDLFKTAFAAHESLSRIAFTDVLSKASVVLVGLPLLLLGLPMTAVLWAFPVSAVVYAAVTVVLTIRRYGWPDFTIDTALLRRYATESLPFFLTTLQAHAYLRVGMVFLNYFHGPSVTGIFAAAQKMAELILIFAGFYRFALVPVLSRLYREAPGQHRILYANSLRYVLLSIVPIAALLALTAEDLVRLLFGAEFAPSAGVLRVVSLYLVFATIRNIIMAVLSSMNQQWQWVHSHLTAFALHVALSLALIPRYGAMGAAWALLCSEAVAVALAARVASHQLGPVPVAPLLWKPAAAALAMGAAVSLLPSLPVMATLPLAGAVGLASLFAIGGLRKQDLRFLQDALR